MQESEEATASESLARKDMFKEDKRKTEEGNGYLEHKKKKGSRSGKRGG